MAERRDQDAASEGVGQGAISQRDLSGGPCTSPPGEGTAAEAEESRVVDEAATRPARGRPGNRNADRDRALPVAVLVLALVLVLGWIGGTTIWTLRRELGVLQARVGEIERREQLDRRVRDLAAVRRALAEIESLRRTLPPEIAPELDPAGRSLEALKRRLAQTR